MGVPKFYGQWLSKKASNFESRVILKNPPSDVITVAIDANSNVYSPLRSVYGQIDIDDFNKLPRNKQQDILRRQEIVKRMTNEQLEAEYFAAIDVKFNNSINRISVSMGQYSEPSCFIEASGVQDLRGRALQTLVIAFDGVAPQAKISQQRSRRYRSYKESPASTRFYTQNITPRTDFFMRLDDHMKNVYIPNRRSTLGRRVIYSSDASPGEAEHKIMDYFRDGLVYGTDSENIGSHVIHGMDTDLIMLTLLLDTERIHLWREDYNIVLNIDNLKTEIQKIMGVHAKSHHDFVLLMFFLGNDFLPHQAGVNDYDNSIDKIIDQYKKVGKPITDQNGIIWENYVEVLGEIAKIEPMLLRHEAYQPTKYTSEVFRYSKVITQAAAGVEQGKLQVQQERQSRFDLNRFRSAWYSYALAPRGDNSIIENLLGYNPNVVTQDNITQMTYHYLSGIAWVYNYYTKGNKHTNQRWYYPYHHAPTISDTHIVLKSVLDQGQRITGWEYNGEGPMSPIHQLLSVIPPQLSSIVPIEVQPLMNPDSPIADYFPTDFYIDRSGVNEKWRGITMIPFVDPYRLINAVNKYSVFEPYRSIMYAPVNDLIQDLQESEIQSMCIKQTTYQNVVDSSRPRQYRKPQYRGRGKGRGRTSQWSETDGRQRSGYRQRGRGGYQQRGRGGYEQRMEYRPRGRGGYNPRGRGTGAATTQGSQIIMPGSSMMLPPPPAINK